MELGFDEVKTEMLERQEALRSQTREGVSQELWGVGLAYNLVRLEMERIAEEAEVVPARISFVMALRRIRDEWMWLAAGSPGPFSKQPPPLPPRWSGVVAAPPMRVGREAQGSQIQT